MTDLNSLFQSPTGSPIFPVSASIIEDTKDRIDKELEKSNEQVFNDGQAIVDAQVDPNNINIDYLFQMQLDLNFRVAALESTVGLYFPSLPNRIDTRSPEASNQLKLRDLDFMCLPFFCVMPNPTSVQLNRLVSQLEATLSQFGRKTLLSNVRKWFRKRRDDNGQKVFAACNDIIPEKLKEGIQIDDIRADIKAHGQIFELIKSLSAIEITETDSLNAFLQEKIKSFLDRRVSRRRSE